MSTHDSSPVIILAPARSCTTLTVAMLDGHPDLCGLPELSLFPSAPLGQLLKTRYSSETSDGGWNRRALVRALAWVKFRSFSPAALDEAEIALAEMSELDSSDVLRMFVARVEPRVLVEKSPMTTAEDEHLAQCIQAFPNARYLHIVRNPTATARSQVRNFRRRGLFPRWTDESLFLLMLRRWYLTHRRICAATDRLADGQWLCFNAEDLRNNPEATLAAILTWLKLDNGPDVIQHMLQTENWPFAAGPDPAYGGDRLFFDDPRFRRAAAAVNESPDETDHLAAVVPAEARIPIAAFAEELRARGEQALRQATQVSLIGRL